jgi:hypothetical protein
MEFGPAVSKRSVQVKQPDRSDDAALPIAHARGRDQSLWLDFYRSVFPSQSEMRAVLVVVANMPREQAFQVAFVNCDDVIQEITPATSYPTLGPADLGDQLPVQTESAAVPTHHGFRRDPNEGLLPSGPKSTNADQEELVEQV